MRETIEPRGGFGKFLPFAGLALERGAQRGAAAIPGDGEQIFVAKAEQRRAQHRRQRQIVLLQQERVGKRHQVHHRNMLGKHQAVGARHFDTLVLERADDRLEQLAALAYQDQNVAAARGAALDADRLPAVDQRAHGPRDSLREFYARTCLVHLVKRRVPAFDRNALVRLFRLPNFDHAGRRIRQGDMRRKAAAIRTDACGDVLEYDVHGAEHTVARTERVLEFSRNEAQSGVVMRPLEITPHIGKLPGRGVLERVDRLLFVADRKNRPPARTRSGAGGEFGGEPGYDLPLLLAGVLRLVDEQMVDAEVELVVHPGGADVAQEIERLVDQVVVIDQAAALFFFLKAGQHRMGDGEQRRAAVAAGDGATALQDGADAFLLGAQALDQGGVPDRLSDDGLSPRKFRRAENLNVHVGAVGAGQRRKRAKAAGLIAIGLGALRQGGGDDRPFRRRDGGAGKELSLDALAIVRGVDTERPRQAGDGRRHAARARHPGDDRVALADGFAHQLAEGHIGGCDHGRSESAAERAPGIGGAIEQYGKRQLFQKLRLLGLVEHAEAGGDVGFERELMEELRAEGVDGLHFQTARRLQRARKQAPRRHAPNGVGRHVRALANGFVERRIVERGPMRKRIEHPLGHIGGGRLGEGEAKDFFRLHPVEQKIDDALRQHVSLAGSGIGGDPGGNVRIGNLGLQPQHGGWNSGRGSHAPPPPSSPAPPAPPVLDHSFTRAR